MHRIRQFIILTVFFSSSALWAGDYQLPDLGNPEKRIFVGHEARNIGLAVQGKLRARGLLLEQPAIAPYIEQLGQKLAAYAPALSGYHFFVIDSPAVNAFAAPGGYIGVNSALIMQTKNEDQLAAVLAHEIGHVSHAHVARSIANAQNNQWIQAVAAVAGVLSASVSQQTGAALTLGGQAYLREKQLQFSRAQEQQADDTGTKILHQAGYDDRQMAAFLAQLNDNGAPEFLQNHPLPQNRLARQLRNAHGNRSPRRPLDYQLAKVAIAHFSQQHPENYQPTLPAARAYQQFLQAQRRNDLPAMQALLPQLPAAQNPVFALLHGQYSLMTGDFAGARKTLRRAYQQSHDSRLIPLYARALLASNDLPAAEKLLQPAIAANPETVPLYDLYGEVLQRQGRFAEQLILTARYYGLIGNYQLASEQLQRALSAPSFPAQQRQKIIQLKNHYQMLAAQDKNH